MQKTMNINGEKVTVLVRRRYNCGNHNGWTAKIGKATYYFNVLDPQEAIGKAIAKYLAATGSDGEQKTAMPQPLTTLDAANIGREMGVRGLIVCRDTIDQRLWRVATHERAEVHEPMDEAEWREFIAGWVDRPRRYDAGRGRKVTVPENDERDLFEAVREQLSPHAVACIASHLSGASTNNPEVDRQVRWFHDQLCELLGGYEQQAHLAQELGL